jgi:hypothetical protein
MAEADAITDDIVSPVEEAPLELTQETQVELSAAEQARAAHADDEAPTFEPPPGVAAAVSPAPKPADRPVMSAKAAVDWFLHDMAEVSGYVLSGFKQLQALSVYATYRPMLTKPDPWYFAGVVAMEASPIIAVYPKDIADELLREIFAQMDAVIGRDDDEASSLTLMLLGRLGLGSMLMGRHVPDNMRTKIMLLLMGSERNVRKIMPDPKAHDQLRAALKSGRPVWWKMFSRRFQLPAEVKGKPGAPKPRTAAKPVDLTAARARRDALRTALEAADIPVPVSMGGSGETAHDAPAEITDTVDDVLEAPLELAAPPAGEAATAG